jgi:CRISPR-associated protein Csx1
MASVLISTWGDPKGWENVTYIMDGRRYPMQTKSSLPAILNYANPKPEKVFIIVLDTVIKHHVSSYKELKDSVVTYYQEFLRSLKLGSEIPVEVIVAPGVGRFRLDGESYAEFLGLLTDYSAYVAYEISRNFLQIGGDELTVHLDLTHGINFMPSLTYAVICEVLGAVAITKKVRLKVYNSEPYIKGVTSELNIHKVEDRQIMPSIKNEALSSINCRLLEPGMVQEEKKVEVDKNYVRELNAFLSSLVNGLPLVYYAFYPDVSSLEMSLNNAVRLWDSNIRIYQKTTDMVHVGDHRTSEARVTMKKMIVERKATFTNEFIKCVTIWNIAKALNHSRKNEVNLSELEDLKKRVFSKWTKLNSMIGYDLEDVKRNVRKWSGPLDDWKMLGTIVQEFYGPVKGDKLARNFLAHSGLENSLTYVKRQHNEILLRYNLKNDAETILQLCLKGLYTSRA